MGLPREGEAQFHHRNYQPTSSLRPNRSLPQQPRRDQHLQRPLQRHNRREMEGRGPQLAHDPLGRRP